jgi:transcriptional regulator with XRE-family HTH domain
MSSQPEQKVHEGRKVKRIREILGIKQDDLANRMGLSQQAVSQLEAKEAIDRDLLEKVAKAMGVNAEAIKSFTDESAINYINTFNDHSVNNGAVYAFNSTINPLEMWMEATEENKKLYERLLQSEKEKVELLQSVLKNKD